MERFFNTCGRLSVPVIVCSVILGIGLSPWYFVALPFGLALLVVALQHNLSVSSIPFLGDDEDTSASPTADSQSENTA